MRDLKGLRAPRIRGNGAFGSVARVGLWCSLALGLLLLVVAAARPSAPVVAPKAEPVAAWPDERALGYAVRFARDYWSFAPGDEEAYSVRLGEYAAGSDLSIEPTWRGATVSSDVPVVADVCTLPACPGVRKDEAIVTVSSRVTVRVERKGRKAKSSSATRFLAVPVMRRGRGLFLSGPPSLVAGAVQVEGRAPDAVDLPAGEQDELADLLLRFFTEYLAGDDEAMAPFLCPAQVCAGGADVRALDERLGLELVALGSELVLASAPSGPVRDVVVDVNARDQASDLPLRYRVRVRRGDRWYVEALQTP